MSSDKQFRTEHETWWPQETVTEEKFQSSLNELTKVNFKIALCLLIQHHHEFYPTYGFLNKRFVSYFLLHVGFLS